MEKTTKIPLFRRCVIQNFPFIEEDFDALTDYGLLCKVVEYLNKVIEQTNTTTTQVEELSVAFNNLKDYVDHYFDNLDVQEEINNKLDEMAEQGVLSDIISQYLNSTAIFAYDTLANMKNAENLVNGSYARTLGYSTKNDGGGALYKIRNITNDDIIDESFIVEMNDSQNQLVAEYIKNGDIYVEQLGALGLADSTTKIQSLIDYSIANNITLSFGYNTFNISHLEFKTAELRFDRTTFNVLTSEEDVAILIENPKKGVSYNNFTVHCNGKTGIKVIGAKNIVLDRVIVEEAKTGFYLYSGYECTLSDSLMKNTEDIVDSIGIRVNTWDSNFINDVVQGYRTGVKTDNNAIGVYFDKVHIWSTNHTTILNSVGFDLAGGAELIQCEMDTCLIGVHMHDRQKLNMNNCRFYWNKNHFTDEILDGATPYLMYFDNKTNTDWVEMYNCFGYIPDTVTTLPFTNIAKADWQGLCNIKAHNRDLWVGGWDSSTHSSYLPQGRTGTVDTSDGSTDLDTPTVNKVLYSNDSFNLEFEAQIKADATGGQITIGTIDKTFAMPLAYKSVCTYGNQWDAAAEGLAYLYINTSGEVITKVLNAMKGKYLKINLNYSK